ncbi:MAG: hypothetical protein ACXVXJ_10855, partial [Mycobacteriaceae bacterium]
RNRRYNRPSEPGTPPPRTPSRERVDNRGEPERRNSLPRWRPGHDPFQKHSAAGAAKLCLAWVPAEDDGTEWGYALLHGQDWVYPEDGAVQGIRQMIVPGGRPFEFRLFSGDDVKIEMSE